jgi:hypothetical protein
MSTADNEVSLSRQWQMLKPAWRVCVATLLAQFVGSGIGLFVQPLGRPFFDLWYGGIHGTPVGFCVGLGWQLFLSPGSLSSCRTVILLLGGLAVFLPMFGYLTQDIWLLR